MHSHRLPFISLFIAILALLLNVACGGGGTTPTQPQPALPVFTSSPVLDASEGAVYTYQLAATDPAGGAVTFSITSAPTGATINGSTITWTPTASQSRVANNFSVKATTSRDGWATQSWSVTPKGTVRITVGDTYWDFDRSRSGPAIQLATYAEALVPQPDGSFQTITGPQSADGVFIVPNVPGGYYWLNVPNTGMYWTSSSTVDLGYDRFGSWWQSQVPSRNTTFNLDFAGLEATTDESFLHVDIPTVLMFGTNAPAGSTAFTGTVESSALLAGTYKALVRQYKRTPVGELDLVALGPTLTLSTPTMYMGGTYPLGGVLEASPDAALNLSIKGSAWAPLFENAAPWASTPAGTSIELNAQPTEGQNAGGGLPLLGPKPSPVLFPGEPPYAVTIEPGCRAHFVGAPFKEPPATPIIVTDQDFGTIHYGDPFPSIWPRTFTICERALVDVPLANSTGTIKYVLTNEATTGKPAGAVVPLISPVRDPKINGASLLSASVSTRNPVTINWTAPALGNAYRYDVQIAKSGTLLDGSPGYVNVAVLSTAKTSVTVPQLLVLGETYVIVITARSDARGNMETSPNHSGLPTAHADFISGLVTIVAAQ